MAAGGDEQILKKMKSGLTKPCDLPNVKDNISSLQSLNEKQKEEYGQKVSNMIEEKQKIEQGLQRLKKLLLEKACKDLPTELHCLLKESKDLPKELLCLLKESKEFENEEEDYLDISSKRQNPGPIIPFSKNRRVVAAIEFGNTFSGYAFSFSNSPEKVYPSVWHDRTTITNKTPTALLLNSEGNFNAFGYEAKGRYSKIVSLNEKEDYYFFQSFRNCLGRHLKPTAGTMVKDISGKSLKAQSIFALSIKFLISKMFAEITELQKEVALNDINIILTVPAIWNDAQIQCLREAATTAGINQEHLSIVHEQIAASYYWRFHQKNTDDREHVTEESEDKKKYLILDLGGDTSNLSVLSSTETDHDEALSTVVCPWAGNAVNHEFTIFLHEIFEPEVMEQFKGDKLSEYFNLMKEFERKKYVSSTKNVENIHIQLENTYKLNPKRTLQEAHVSTIFIQVNELGSPTLHLPTDILNDFFKPAINGILEYLSKVLDKKENMDVDTIVMVGGFSECKQIQKAITDAFPSKDVIIPDDPGLAILKGAVFCGHIPLTLHEGVAKYTYGIQCYPEFDPKIHPENKKIILGKTAYCKDVFCKYVEKGTEVPVGTKTTRIFRVLSPEIKYLTCELYASTVLNPVFIDDETCIHIGTISVTLPQMGPECLIMEESVSFWETEIRIEARDINFQTHKVHFTFQ